MGGRLGQRHGEEKKLTAETKYQLLLQISMAYPRHGHAQNRIAGIAQRGFDTDRGETNEMLMHGKGIVGHVIRTGESIVAADVRLLTSHR